MKSEKDIRYMALDETCLLKDFEAANNYIGVKIQKRVIEVLDDLLEIEVKS